MVTRKQYADYQQIEAIALPKKLGNLLKTALWWPRAGGGIFGQIQPQNCDFKPPFEINS